jgi:hypothetical protein
MAGADDSALRGSSVTGYLSLPTIAPTMPRIVTTPLRRKTTNNTIPRAWSTTAPF